MGFFNKKKKIGLISDIIRCDEPSYLIWKWHPTGTEEGENKREYSIRSGSHLRVKDGEVAVFVYKQKDGTMQDFIVGPYDETLKTANLPILSGIIGTFVGGDTPFQAEVYFINLARVLQVNFGVPYFDVYDPRYPDFGVPIAVRGTVTFKIHDYREFIKLHRLSTFNLDDFQAQIKDSVTRYVKNAVAITPIKQNIPVVQIESKLELINSTVEEDITERLKTDFGVIVSGVDISAIEIDKSSSGYRKLISITADITEATIKAQTAANIENYAETLRIQREEGQYAMHMQTQNANIAAYQIEKQTEVGIAGAEALGNMGANNAGNVNLGDGNGMGFNPAAMMASIAVGGVVGQNIAGVMNGALNNQTVPGAMPPPIPTVMYNVVQNGQSVGPFDISALTAMATRGEINATTLVWTQGMSAWVKAGEVKEIAAILPPPIPQ